MFFQLCFISLVVAVCSAEDKSDGRSFQNVLFQPVTPFCSRNPYICRNGGTCINYRSGFRCQCTSLCHGKRCGFCRVVSSITLGQKAGVCNPNPCKRDCQCHESCRHAGGYYCRSSSGFLGKNCTIPVPLLQCDKNQIVFSVSESFVREYDLGLGNSYVSVTRRLGDRVNCEVLRNANGMYEITVPLPFTSCGTEATEANGVMVFTNQMWFNRRLANSMFDMPIPVAEFQCRYEKQYRVVTSLRPVVSTPVVISDSQFLAPSISLCKMQSCPATCPVAMTVNGGGVYTVGEMIHVSMSIDSGNRVTAIEEMYLSCSVSPSTSGFVEIVRDGCGSTSGLPCEITASASSNVVCVSFQTPRSMGCQEFYIHAKLQSCSRQDVTVCPDFHATKKCLQSRRKRSLVMDVAPVALGPISIINGSSGLSMVNLYGMEKANQLYIDLPPAQSAPATSPTPSVTSSPTTLSVFMPFVISVFSVLCVLAVLMSFYIFFLRSKSLSD